MKMLANCGSADSLDDHLKIGEGIVLETEKPSGQYLGLICDE
jgi:hypothetical protein